MGCAAAGTLGPQKPSPDAGRGPGGGAQVCGAESEALRSCERKCERVTAPGPPGACAAPSWVRVGWLGRQASVFSSVSRTPGAAPVLRYPGRGKPAFCTREGRCGRFSRGDHGLHAVRDRWLDGMSRLLEDLTPAGGKWPSHPRTDATCLLPEPRRSRPEPAAGGVAWAWPGGGGAWIPGSAEAGDVLTQRVRREVGPAAGRAAEARGLVPRAPWPKPSPISTTRTWATSTTVRGQGGPRGVRDAEVWRLGLQLTNSLLYSQGLGTL